MGHNLESKKGGALVLGLDPISIILNLYADSLNGHRVIERKRMFMDKRID